MSVRLMRYLGANFGRLFEGNIEAADRNINSNKLLRGISAPRNPFYVTNAQYAMLLDDDKYVKIGFNACENFEFSQQTRI